MCILFEICEKRPFQKCVGRRGGGGEMITFLTKRSCKVDDAKDRAMLEGPLIILNPNRPHCCSLPRGQGPHWGTHSPVCELERIFSSFPNPAACVPLYDPKIDLQKKRPLWTSKFGAPYGSMQVAVNRLCEASWPAWQGAGSPSSKFHPRACSFANQRLLWCIGGSNSTWCEFVYGHGSCLLTKEALSYTGTVKNGRKTQTYRLYISSVQHADLGCSE